MGIRLTAEQLARLPAEVRDKLRKPSKYRAQRTVVDGISFPSRREAGRYEILKELQKLGDVRWFVRQPLFDTGGGTTYRADFLIVWDAGHVTVEDAKGMRTAAFIRAKKQVEAAYPIKIEEV